MKKKLTVTVGIPAYNEQANIGRLIKSLLRQRQGNFSLKKILIISDGSSDETNQIINSFRNKRVSLVVNEQRRGQAYTQNLIFSSVKTDVVVILEADTKPFGSNYLLKLVKPIIKNPLICLVQGNAQPLKPQTLIEKILYYQVLVYRKFIIKNPDIWGWLCSGRGGRVFTRSVFNNLSWPKDLPEDVYASLWCKQRNLLTVFEKSAICNYRLPQAFNDLLKERQKINSGNLSLKNYFPNDYLKEFYQRPKFLIGKMFLYFFMTKPFHCILYLLLTFNLHINISEKKFTDFWPMAYSTRILYKTI